MGKAFYPLERGGTLEWFQDLFGSWDYFIMGCVQYKGGALKNGLRAIKMSGSMLCQKFPIWLWGQIVQGDEL
jgi:hypothetical protein